MGVGTPAGAALGSVAAFEVRGDRLTLSEATGAARIVMQAVALT